MRLRVESIPVLAIPSICLIDALGMRFWYDMFAMRGHHVEPPVSGIKKEVLGSVDISSQPDNQEGAQAHDSS